MGHLAVIGCGCVMVDSIDAPVLSTSSRKQEKRKQRKPATSRGSATMWKPSLVSIPENRKLAAPPTMPGPCWKVGKKIEKAEAVRRAKASPGAEEIIRYFDTRDVFSALGASAFAF